MEGLVMVALGVVELGVFSSLQLGNETSNAFSVNTVMQAKCQKLCGGIGSNLSSLHDSWFLATPQQSVSVTDKV